MTRTLRIAAGGFAALAAVAVIIAGSVTWATKPYPCRATFEQVREGMTRAEVEATVGGPPDVYAAGWRPGVDYLRPVPVMPGGHKEWVAWDGHLVVWFTPEGMAQKVAVWDMGPKPTLLARVRSMIGF